MKHLSKLFLCLAIALSTCKSYAAVDFSTPFVPRSQSVNAALELVGWQQYVNRCDSMYGVFTITPAWQQTFQSDQIARSLFGEETLTFSGSRVANRNPKDILADYFGLPMDYNETVKFSPRIQNFMLDFNMYVGLFWGFYLRAHLPLVHSRWNLREEISIFRDNGQQGHPEGYFSAGALGNGLLNADILEAFKGTKQVGDLNPLAFGKINGERSVTKLSDLQFAFGWNLAGDSYHVGLNVRASAPTGNESTGEYLFEPVIGDYNRWNVGGGLSTHLSLWSDDCYSEDLSLHLDANITHIVGRCMKRTFDLKDKTGSRYMTAIDLSTTPSVNLDVNAVVATNQYNGTAQYLSSLTTLDADISASAQVDIAVKFAYARGGLSLDLGYEFWARTKEKLACDGRQKISSELFALKGDAQLYGFGTAGGNIALGVAHPIVVSQSQADLFGPQLTAAGLPNTTDDVAAAVRFTNANADTANVVTDTGAALNQVSVAGGGAAPAITITPAQINGSSTPVFITDALIDDDSGLAKAATSHKIFLHMNYAWKELCDFDPFIGVGGSAEFAQHRGTEQNDRVCKDAGSASQWSVWFKGGIAF